VSKTLENQVVLIFVSFRRVKNIGKSSGFENREQLARQKPGAPATF